MQAVPSLVGTGTAIAAAAAGLVFGQPSESEAPPWSSPAPGVFSPDYDAFRVEASSGRPNTSAAALHQICYSPVRESAYGSLRHLVEPNPSPVMSPTTIVPQSQRPVSAVPVSSPRTNSRRQSFLRHERGESASRHNRESSRESLSSRESWIRRLSLRPISQHGSPRSSMGPDSSSLTFSHGSGVPMLGQQGPANHAPNKLVKRNAPGLGESPCSHQRRGSRTQVLTLRRPATSHQRQATLQQQSQPQGNLVDPPPSAGTGPKFSFEPSSVPETETPTSSVFSGFKRSSGRWTSFFHARRAAGLGRDTTGLTSGQRAKLASLFPKRRVSLTPGHISRAYLTKADCITDIPVFVDEVEQQEEEFGHIEDLEALQSPSDPTDSAETSPDKRPKRSMSMHFSSAQNWIARKPSVRRPRRSTVDAKSGNNNRYATDLAGTLRDPMQSPASPTTQEIVVLPNYQPQAPQLEPAPILADAPRNRKRNSPSPLPPLNRLSSFNIDVSRLGLSSSSSSTAPSRSFQAPINYMNGSQGPPGTHSRGPSGERSVTLAGSDFDVQDVHDADDEDTDVRSDAYDSFRTVASSSRVRSVETPLESMFDESPPSTASNGKTKRLSIQEMLGRGWDGETKIPEEEENLATPIRNTHLDGTVKPVVQGVGCGYGGQGGLMLVNRDFARLSFDDDDDDDWARDDDNTLSNHLSPPSSTNSRRVSPTLRHALRNMGGNGSPDPSRESISDRPRSSIFDWSEPSTHDKLDSDATRPKTVHGKQEMDLRVGRSTSRKAPKAGHVRSQSVPVVPEPTDESKPPAKFGTWGLGSKNVSEDWDDDFDFDETALDITGGKDSNNSFMVVPPSIQASQPSVKAHSGQIRELSLLVNDLKRLCRHGKDLNIIHGPIGPKWVEAENIIALASPDEDETDEFGSVKSSLDFDRDDLDEIDERFIDEGFDGSMLDDINDPFEIPGPQMTRTTVVRERATVRRRSVFSPDDDIFGGKWPLPDEPLKPPRPRTPDGSVSPNRSSAVLATVIEAMQQQRSTSDPIAATATKTQDTKLFFDTNSLQELVKRAGHLRDSLSDAVRKAELLTQSPAATPRHERLSHRNLDGSPAFTRVFSDPAASSPPRRLPKSHSSNSILGRGSVDSPRMQMMIVS
ncbi:hypothetical protein QBC40DRAFT_67119 [Triangularia verruculosa]|uniref:Uncharacterized protein n=1 Tax=Triangularia verruculosa TaxID=2587418 RepID=A0AAN6XHQ7_9PEZI|nr:hypothetical protein QBC40DRAFT_67119 [Triangularia verruculosa]